jgi:hypothetical protein
MSSMRLNARLDTSHHGPPHPFKDVGVVADSLIGIHNALVKCLFVVNRSANPEDSSQASMEAMQWVLLYVSIRHERCYVSRTRRLKCAGAPLCT